MDYIRRWLSQPPGVSVGIDAGSIQLDGLEDRFHGGIVVAITFAAHPPPGNPSIAENAVLTPKQRGRDFAASF